MNHRNRGCRRMIDYEKAWKDLKQGQKDQNELCLKCGVNDNVHKVFLQLMNIIEEECQLDNNKKMVE